MKTIRFAIILMLSAVLSGCVMPMRPAKTLVTPGESRIRSERQEVRPSETTLRIRAVTPAQAEPAPAPIVYIQIRLLEGE